MDIAGRKMSCCLRKETLALAQDYINYCNGIQQAPPSETARAMRCLAKKMEQQYHSKFHSLSQSFLAACGSDPSACLHGVMTVLVEDGKLNWGRVVSLFTFTGVLAPELFSRDEGPEYCSRLAETIADYLGEEKKDWLVENEGWIPNVPSALSTKLHPFRYVTKASHVSVGRRFGLRLIQGEVIRCVPAWAAFWEGFCKFFRRADHVSQESSMKTALFAAAGVGLAGLTFLLVR
ncbi:hypothetical protein NFI96_013339 [Prochilodus magdalenae]|nr:hypothetical protein NFI96_013339 [Prochilodus magdalenae]